MLFGPLLPQLFILGEEEATAGWSFRLAGGFLNDLHGRELRHSPYLDLWSNRDRPHVAAAIDVARRAAQPVILSARGYADAERHVGLEIMLAPLTGPTDTPNRVLGLYQPVSMTARLQGAAVERLVLEGVEGAPGAEPAQRRASLRLVVDNTRP